MTLPTNVIVGTTGHPALHNDVNAAVNPLVFDNQAINLVYATPSSGAAAPAGFRALVAADIPNLNASKITAGALALARGGTNADLSASGSATAILAQDASHVVSARALVAADIPVLSYLPSTALATDTVTDATTFTAPNILTLAHRTSGTPLTQFGTSLQFQTETDNHTLRNNARIAGLWNVVVDGVQQGGMNFYVNDSSGERAALKLGANGSAAQIGFLNTAAISRQVDGAALINNVVASGTTNQIDDFTSLTVYATDAAAIHNDIYQLARKLKIVDDALRAYGLLT